MYVCVCVLTVHCTLSRKAKQLKRLCLGTQSQLRKETLHTILYSPAGFFYTFYMSSGMLKFEWDCASVCVSVFVCISDLPLKCSYRFDSVALKSRHCFAFSSNICQYTQLHTNIYIHIHVCMYVVYLFHLWLIFLLLKVVVKHRQFRLSVPS